MLIRFLQDHRGGIAPMMGLLALPLMGAVGMAVDYSRANATRAAFQAALDSTVLMLAKNAATQSAADIQTTATNYFKALYDLRKAEAAVFYATGTDLMEVYR
jgi:Flp pilus assembly protein TadG